jgi:bile acid:Na+ symporter, BASS family
MPTPRLGGRSVGQERREEEMDLQTVMSFTAVAGAVGTMVSMGLRLGIDDFRRIAQTPKALFTGLFGQMVLLPATAIFLAVYMDLPPAIAAGLILIGACPGGTMSNSLTYIARGDVALSVSLTTVTSSVAFLSLPLIMLAGLSLIGTEAQQFSLPFIDTAVRVLLTTIVPVAAGMIVLQKWPSMAERVRTPLFWASLVAIIFPSAMLAITRMPEIIEQFGVYAFTGALLNIVMLILASVLAWLMSLPLKQMFTVILEVGMQGYGLVVVVALTIMNDFTLMVAGISYLGFSILTGLAIAFVGRRMISSTEHSDQLKPVRA